MQVYRFGDRVAMNPPGGGHTFYVDPPAARQITRAMNRVAREIERGVNFTDSTVGTIQITKLKKEI